MRLLVADGHLAIVIETAGELAAIETVGLREGGDWIPLVRQDRINPNTGRSRISHLQAGGVMPMVPGAVSAPQRRAIEAGKGEPAYRTRRPGEQVTLQAAIDVAMPGTPVDAVAPKDVI